MYYCFYLEIFYTVWRMAFYLLTTNLPPNLTAPAGAWSVCNSCFSGKNFNKTYIGETGRAFGVRLQEHRQEVSQRDVRAYTRNASRSLAGEQNKSAVMLPLSTTSYIGIRPKSSTEKATEWTNGSGRSKTSRWTETRSLTNSPTSMTTCSPRNWAANGD